MTTLDGDHAQLVQTALPVCVAYGLAVAGGYAIKAHGLVERPSEDIDFAAATAASLDEIVTAWLARTAGRGMRSGSSASMRARDICSSHSRSAGRSTQIGLDIAEAEPWPDEE